MACSLAMGRGEGDAARGAQGVGEMAFFVRLCARFVGHRYRWVPRVGYRCALCGVTS